MSEIRMKKAISRQTHHPPTPGQPGKMPPRHLFCVPQGKECSCGRGYLLMEGLIAIALIAVALGPLLSALQSGQKALLDGKLQAQALAFGEAHCEEMRYRWAQDLIPGDEWASSAVHVDPDGHFIGSYTLATLTMDLSPPPNSIATLIRFDLEVIHLPGWASFSTPVTNFEGYRDPDNLGAAVHLTAFFGGRD